MIWLAYISFFIKRRSPYANHSHLIHFSVESQPVITTPSARAKVKAAN
jgi:hypothetical protein